MGFMGQQEKISNGCQERQGHERCVAGALRDAERVCREREVTLTPIRKRVLEMVWKGHKPVKAYEIIDNFGGSNKAAKPPTVYRALDFLVENGLVHRIESQNAFIGCAHPVEGHTASFLICTECQMAEEIDSHRLDQCIDRLAADKGFKVEHKTVEVYGLCPTCIKRQ